MSQKARSRGWRAAAFTETMMAARQCVHQALDAADPELAGLLIDIAVSLKVLRISNVSGPGPRVLPKSYCNSRLTDSPATTDMWRRRGDG